MFDAFLAYHARTRPRALAVMTPRRRATYAELDADVNRFAAGLMALGVTPARGVVCVDPTSAYHRHVLILALARLGVASSWQDDRRADLRLSQRPGETTDKVLRLTREWTARTEAATPVPVPSARRDPEGLARVMLSSGTTRTPRRIPLTWRGIAANSLNGMPIYGAGRLGTWVIRTSIDSGLGYMLATLAWTVGAAVVSDFETAEIPKIMERRETGLLGVTPIQLRELLQGLPPAFELKPEWRVVSTGGVLPPSVALEARRRLTPDVQLVYGSTEASRATAGPASLLETTLGAVGWPLPGVELDIVGPDGRVLPDGEAGEVRIRSDRIAKGYIDDPEATARVFRDGYVYQGDVGRRLPDGSFVIDGRIDERMNIGGIKLLPNVLEDAALSHPGVIDAAAFALPDAVGQDQLWMAIVAGEGLTREALISHLARFQRLPSMRFAWTEAIPRNSGGKIDREALRAETQAAIGPAAAMP